MLAGKLHRKCLYRTRQKRNFILAHIVSFATFGCKVTTIFSNIQDLDAKKYNMLAIF